MALPRAKLGVSLFRHPCRKPLSPGKGLYYWGYRPKSKQGCLQSATQSHCTMQWYKWLTTCMGGYAPQPHFLITKKFFYRLLIYVFYRNIIYQCGDMKWRYGAITAPLRNPLPRRTFLPVRKTNPLRFRSPYNLH